MEQRTPCHFEKALSHPCHGATLVKHARRLLRRGSAARAEGGARREDLVLAFDGKALSRRSSRLRAQPTVLEPLRLLSQQEGALLLLPCRCLPMSWTASCADPPTRHAPGALPRCLARRHPRATQQKKKKANQLRPGSSAAPRSRAIALVRWVERSATDRQDPSALRPHAVPGSPTA